jgi:cellulose synthase/poly-beta-1,6-N-acetylglucosamine synthase-like glycosyltransferase
MLDFILVPASLVYLLVVGLLFIYGVNFFYLTFLAVRRSGDPITPPLIDYPQVTVQLPVYNELYVAERLVNAAANLDYPAQLLEIQVLDDSTDETTTLLKNRISQLRIRGVNIQLIHRENREGFKAGALAAGLTAASGEFLAIFDADFVPPPDFLKKTLPFFVDPRIAFLQTRWDHLNHKYSLLTRLQALAIDAHFVIEQTARSGGGYWFNFNGTAGIWRKAAIVDSGGWKADTLTEDLDLSYRSFLHGWKAVYLRDVKVPAELPVSFNAYRRQQQRWARGSLECARRLIPQVWRAPISIPSKIQSTLHLTGYLVHLLLFALALLYLPILVFGVYHPGLVSIFGLAILFNFTALAPTAMFVMGQRQKQSGGWIRQLPAILFLTVLGCGMMMNTASAAQQAFKNRPGKFERTPKFGIDNRQQNWMERKKYQLKFDFVVYLELLLAIWNGITTWLAYRSGNWSIGLYAGLFCCGLIYVAGMSILQTLAVRWHRFEPSQSAGD